ncbi:metallophosphoesterase family protein [Clostridium vincentii]|uniref:Putative metallophosphoesterase YhaO n=1 Tax=Clostridium vincentii TaxID=52704 RepID=A0A2T0B5I2_9CLOT|nr:DNA repair exonuclease [Clostridium vincentii]PRR79136.1 putative metallophosphoesterase YhaO [Clostridium vincentii]
MKKIKIVHTADLHFDTPFKEVGEVQSKINKEELKEIFMDIIHLCKNESVEILLLAGDIFDNYTLNRETLYFIEKAFEKIPNTRVFISPGNHDPYSNNNFYKLINWPSNVYIFKENIEQVEIKELGTTIWGGAFNDKYVRESMLEGFSKKTDKINIMVLHGEIANSKEGNEYNPITLKEISESGMDYIALGHRHGFSGINKVQSTYYAYSGCPQGRGFDELGDKGVIYGYISKGAIELDFIKTSKRNYEEIKIDISKAFTYEEIINIILEKISEENRRKNLYKIILSGEISDKFNIDEGTLKDKISSKFYFCKLIDKTTIEIDLEKITNGYSMKSIFAQKLIKELEKAETDEDKEIIRMALKIGLSSLTEGEVKIDDY